MLCSFFSVHFLLLQSKYVQFHFEIWTAQTHSIHWKSKLRAKKFNKYKVRSRKCSFIETVSVSIQWRIQHQLLLNGMVRFSYCIVNILWLVCSVLTNSFFGVCRTNPYCTYSYLQQCIHSTVESNFFVICFDLIK